MKITNWTYSNFNGLYTRVHIFIENEQISNQISSNVSIRNINISSDQYDLQKVSQDGSQNNNDSEKNLTLVAEIPLSKLDRIDYYKYCIPSNSILLKSNGQQIISNLEIQDCKLDYLGSQFNSENEKTKKEEISFLLNLITKFIETQHALNVLMFYDSLSFNENVSDRQATSSKIASVCNLKNNSTQGLIRELFFNPQECFFSPSFAQINLSLNLTQSSTLNKQHLSDGKLKGFLRYGIFDYSASLKKIFDFDKSFAFLDISWPSMLDLKPITENYCSLDFFYKFVKSKEWNFKEIEKRCV